MGDSSSNGRAKRPIQELQGLVCTMKVALEERLKQRTSIMHPLAPWLIKHAATKSNNYTIRESGKTSHELIKGRRCIEIAAEFGEHVFFRPPLSAREKAHKDSWRNRFEEDIWIGTVFKSAETLIATPHGVFRAGCIRRKVVAERWSVPLTDAIRGKPSEPVPESGDWKIPTYVRPELRGSEIETPDDTEFVPQPSEEERPTVRQLFVCKADVETHGPTAGCATCTSIALN